MLHFVSSLGVAEALFPFVSEAFACLHCFADFIQIVPQASVDLRIVANSSSKGASEVLDALVF